MTWLEDEGGWLAAVDDIVQALSSEGFAACKREMTNSWRDSHPAGGIWQGVDTRTGSVASVKWVNRAPSPQAVVFITVDGKSLMGPAVPSERDPYREDGGEA